MSVHEIRMIQTTNGLDVKLQPVAGYLLDAIKLAVRSEFRKRGEPIDPPTYTVETASGAKETHPHNETTLETDADRAAWAAHKDALQRLDVEEDLRVTKCLLLEGIICDDPPAGWAEKMAKRYGIATPTDPDELKVIYLQTDVLRTKADLQAAMAAIFRLMLAGAPEETIQAVEASFRGTVERAGSADGAAAGGRVELQPGV